MTAKNIGLGIVIGGTVSKSYFGVFDTVAKRTSKLGSAISETNRKIGATKDVVKYQRQLKQLQTFQTVFGESSVKVAHRMEMVAGKFEDAKRRAEKYGISIGDVVREQKLLEKESLRLGKTMGHLRKAEEARVKFGAIRAKALGAVGLAFAGGKAVSSGIGIEQAGLRLKTVINADDTEAAVGRAINHAREFARKSLASEGDILDIMYSLSSAGLDERAARFGTEIVSKVAKVTRGSAENVGTIVGDIFNNMGSKMTGSTEEKLTRIGDLLTKTQFKFSIKNFDQLGESLKEGVVGSLSSNVGLEQTVALLGQLNSGALKGSQAGTAYSAMLRQMTKASNDFGFAIDRNDKGQMDVIATLENLKRSLAEYSDQDQRAAAIQKSFGDEGKKGLVILLENLEKLKENYRDVNEASRGIVDNSYKDLLDSLGGQLDMLNQNLSAIGSTLAGTVLPAINVVVRPLAKGAGIVGQLAQDFPILGKTLGVVTTGFVGYGATLAGVAGWQWAANSAVVASTNSIFGQAAAWTWSKGVMLGSVVATKSLIAVQWLWNAALTANPIGLVIAGVTAFGALAYTVYKNWEPIMNWFKEKFAWLGKTVSWVKGIGSSLFGGGKKAVVGSAIAASAALPVAAAPLPALPSPAGQNIVHQSNQNSFKIYQQPGESSGDLAKRVAREMLVQQQADQRRALHD